MLEQGKTVKRVKGDRGDKKYLKGISKIRGTGGGLR